MTNPKSVERGYGPVCWQKIEVELWLGDVAIPEVHMLNPLARRKAQNPELANTLAANHRTLDEFLFVEVEPHLVEGPIQKAILVEG